MSEETRPAARRLDIAVAETLGVSRAEARRLLKAGRVSIDGDSGRPFVKGSLVPADVRITVKDYQAVEQIRPIPEAGSPVRLLAEGSGWVAVEKTAGIPVHPQREDERGTILNALIARRPELFGVGEGGLKSGVLHRLDVPTSGVLIFATCEDRWHELRAAFAAHQFEKRYRGVIAGRPDLVGSLELELFVAQHRPARVRVARNSRERRRSRLARLSWTTVDQLDGATLLEIQLETGFLHQIRASLSELGHPVLGDLLYGDARSARRTARLMLHASLLNFSDIFAQCSDPEDFQLAISSLRGNY